MESPRPSAQAHRKPINMPIIFAPVYVSSFFIAAAVLIPWTYIQKSHQRRRERTFADQMLKAGRLIGWQEFKQVEGKGTAIGEYHCLVHRSGACRYCLSDPISIESAKTWCLDSGISKD